jgi:hypothetical protein
MKRIPKKNKKQIHEYKMDTQYALETLQREIGGYLEIAESEHISHNDITTTINVINWASRTINENREDAQMKILIRQHQELTNRPV